MGRRQGPSEERRLAILAAADEVFGAEGYAGASIRLIARRAQVSSALLYWFFPSKAKLFTAVLLAKIDAQGLLAFPAEILDLPPEVVLPRMAQGYMQIVGGGEQVRLLKLLLRESDREPELTQALSQAITGRVLVPLRAYIARQIELGRIRPGVPDHVTQVVIGPLIALALRREILQEPESQTWDLAAFAATSVDIFLHGALAAPGVAGPAPIPAAEAAPARQEPRQAHRITVEE